MLDIDQDLPSTPTKSGFVDESEIAVSVSSLFAYLSAMDLYPVVYEGENDGRLLRNVVPKEGMENQVSSYGSKQSFLPHIDNPDLALRSEIGLRDVYPCPDTLSLLCLRQIKNVATSIIKLDDVLGELSDDDIALLQDNVFNVSRPASFSNHSILRDVPLLSKYNQIYISRFDYHNVFTDSLEHKYALDNFKKSSIDEKKWIRLYLKPAQIVTFDNQRTLHTRDGFTPKFNGFDRWLIRVFGLYQKPAPKYLLSPNCNHHLSVPLC